MLNLGFILKQNYVVLLAGAEFVLALRKVTPLPFTRFAGQILDWRKKSGILFLSKVLQMAHISLKHKLNW